MDSYPQTSKKKNDLQGPNFSFFEEDDDGEEGGATEAPVSADVLVVKEQFFRALQDSDVHSALGYDVVEIEFDDRTWVEGEVLFLGDEKEDENSVKNRSEPISRQSSHNGKTM